jgi:hypothetical protein
MNGLKSRILFLVFVIFTISLVETIQIADAEEIFVNSGNFTQDIITNANSGDVINFAAGIFSGPITIDKDLTIIGNGNDTLITSEWTLSSSVSISNLKSLNSTGNAFRLIESGNYTFDNITIENAGSNGIRTDNNTNGLGASITVKNSDFINNGLISTSNPADLQFFNYEGNTRLENITITKAVEDFFNDISGNGLDNHNENTFGIQYIGNTCHNGKPPFSPISIAGNNTLENVKISGSPNKEGLLIQCYSDVSGFSMNDVDLSEVETSIGSFWPSALLVVHNGTIPLDIGNLKTQEIFNANIGGIDARQAEFFDSSLIQITDNKIIESLIIHKFDHLSLGTVKFFDEIIVGNQVNSTEQNLIIEILEPGIVELPSGTNNILLSSDTVINLNSGIVDIPLQPIVIASETINLEKEVVLSSATAQPIVIINNDLPTITVTIPDDTTISSVGTWNGKIQPPTAASNSGDAPSGFTVGDNVIEIGSPTSILVFNQTAVILLPDTIGAVGYKAPLSTTWIPINAECGNSFDFPTDPVFPGECFINNGIDTKIVTFHFTSFGPLDPIPPPATPTPTESSSGGSGRTNVSPEEIAKKSSTSLSRVGDWVSSKDYFKIGIRDLISKGYVENVSTIPTQSPPDWFYNVGKEWDAGNISNEEYFNAIKYLIDHKILK